MNRPENLDSNFTAPNCAKCGATLVNGSGYRHFSDTLCEECYIDARTPRTRKTHWQYIGSVKGQYFRETSGG